MDAVGLEEAQHRRDSPARAKERSIDVTDSRSENAGNYRTLIRVTVKAEDRTRTIVGSLFGDANPRISYVDQYNRHYWRYLNDETSETKVKGMKATPSFLAVRSPYTGIARVLLTPQ